jgi:GMP synthase (glutamine-hydrolysing)
MKTIKPFLLLQTRPEDETSNNEYDGFLTAADLTPEQLVRIRVEAAPLPEINLDNYSGIILGGSPFSISKPEDEKTNTQQRIESELFSLLDTLVDRDYPFFGACYGVGILGKHQGGIIGDKYGEMVMATNIQLSHSGKNDPICDGLPDTFQAIVGHKESCEVLPPNAVNLASSSGCPIQMFRIKNNLYATQFHPELDLTGITIRIKVYKHHGYFAPEEAEDVLERTSRADLSHAPTILRNFVKRYKSGA